MKIREIITEAHHHIVGVPRVGIWNLHVDTHALVSAADRDVSMEDFENILEYACSLPDLLDIPLNKGVYFQDVNTMISVYLKRIGQHDLRVETVLGANMQPKPPMYRRAVPPETKRPASPDMQKMQQSMKVHTQAHGRDTVSQELQTIQQVHDMRKQLHQGLNRQERRAMDRQIAKAAKRIAKTGKP